MISRRAFLASVGGLVCVAVARPARTLPPIAMARHEAFMRLAIAEGRKNPMWPFGAVMVRPESGEVMARGVNDSQADPILHGEIACMHDYVRRHGNRGWASLVLYTTAEPCPMCMSALVWAGIGGVVYGTSIEGISRAGIAADRDQGQGGGRRLAVLQGHATGRRAAGRDRPDCSWTAGRRRRPPHVSLMLHFWMMLPNILLSSVMRPRKSFR